MYRYEFNVFTNQFDLVPTSLEFAEKLADTFNATPTSAPGNLVVASQTLPDTVEEITSNVFNDLIFGVVLSKPTTTTAEVLISGRLDNFFTGLTFGKTLFVSPTGGVTTTPPTSGHKQIIGRALTSSSIYLLPATEKTILQG